MYVPLSLVENPRTKLQPRVIGDEAPLRAEINSSNPLLADLEKLPVGFPLPLRDWVIRTTSTKRCDQQKGQCLCDPFSQDDSSAPEKSEFGQKHRRTKNAGSKVHMIPEAVVGFVVRCSPFVSRGSSSYIAGPGSEGVRYVDRA